MSASAPSVRVGIVGVGRMGRRHAENLATRVPGATLVAACSPIGEELEWARDALGVQALDRDYAALLARKDVDAVFLVTPNTLHPAQIIAALRAGKHVFCEKPLSMVLDECLEVEAEAAKHPHLKVMIGFVRRFDASYQDAQKSIASGAIGRPFLVRSQTTDQNDPSGFFVKFAPTSGGIFVDMSVHDIDLARWLLGSPEPKRVFSLGTVAVHQGLEACGDVDNGIALCEFADGRIACFYASRTMAHGHETATEIIGTDGRLTVGRDGRLNQVEIADAHGRRSTSASPTPSCARRSISSTPCASTARSRFPCTTRPRPRASASRSARRSRSAVPWIFDEPSSRSLRLLRRLTWTDTISAAPWRGTPASSPTAASARPRPSSRASTTSSPRWTARSSDSSAARSRSAFRATRCWAKRRAARRAITCGSSTPSTAPPITRAACRAIACRSATSSAACRRSGPSTIPRTTGSMRARAAKVRIATAIASR